MNLESILNDPILNQKKGKIKYLHDSSDHDFIVSDDIIALANILSYYLDKEMSKEEFSKFYFNIILNKKFFNIPSDLKTFCKLYNYEHITFPTFSEAHKLINNSWLPYILKILVYNERSWICIWKNTEVVEYHRDKWKDIKWNKVNIKIKSNWSSFPYSTEAGTILPYAELLIPKDFLSKENYKNLSDLNKRDFWSSKDLEPYAYSAMQQTMWDWKNPKEFATKEWIMWKIALLKRRGKLR